MSAKQRLKVAFYWCASCGGCEEAVIDLAEDILPVMEAVEILFWPVALDYKRLDVEGLSDGELAVSFLNGAVRTSEQEEMVKLLRKRSRTIVSFGSCSHLGGIPGLANLTDKKAIFELLYGRCPSVDNPVRSFPKARFDAGGMVLTLPELYDTVMALDQVIDVDYYLPGCAPPADLIKEAIEAILEGRLPPKGAVLAPDKALCDTCPRKESKPDEIRIEEIRRMPFTEIAEDSCFLAHGVICMGPATRSGCGERCINANMPCRGCFGPPQGVHDQGAKFLSALTSIVESEDPEQIQRIMDSVLDPTGIFYMYSLPSSIGSRFLDTT